MHVSVFPPALPLPHEHEARALAAATLAAAAEAEEDAIQPLQLVGVVSALGKVRAPT